MGEENNITTSAAPDDRSKDIITSNELNNSVRQPTPPPPQQEPVSGSVARQNNAVTEEPQSQVVTSPPPLPPSLLSPQGGISTGDISETVRSIVTDIIKNVTIDGASAQISGSSIQFNTQNNPSASSQWAQQIQPPPDPNAGTAAQNPNPDMGSLMGGPKSAGQAAAEREAQQEAEDKKWGWNMGGSRSSKEVAEERQAQQEAKDEANGWNMGGSKPTETTEKLYGLRAEAAEYGIDTRGMTTTRQLKKAIAEAKEEDEAEQGEFESRFEKFLSSLKGKSDDKKDDDKKGDDKKSDDNKGEKEKDKTQERNSSKEDSSDRHRDTVEVLPVWVTTADESKKRVAYFVAASNHDISDGTPPDQLTETETGLTFATDEYYISGGGGGSGTHPFKVTLSTDGGSTKYKVFLRSSITNGINGDAFTITGLNEDKTFEAGFVVAEAAVTSNPFEVSGGFEIKVVASSTDAKEVLLESGNQSKIRLFIAKLTGTSGGEGENAPKAWQAITTSFRTAVSFNNGIPVYILQAAPTHPDSI